MQRNTTHNQYNMEPNSSSAQESSHRQPESLIRWLTDALWVTGDKLIGKLSAASLKYNSGLLSLVH